MRVSLVRGIGCFSSQAKRRPHAGEAGDARSMLHPRPDPGGRLGPEQGGQEVQGKAARKQGKAARKFLAQTHNPPTVFTAATASLE